VLHGGGRIRAARTSLKREVGSRAKWEAEEVTGASEAARGRGSRRRAGGGERNEVRFRD
jgi:hypothetical protein